MNSETEYSIYQYKEKPIDIDLIYNLWRKDSKTLGFFPKGAFEEYAQKNQIILAFSESNQFIGYLLYRLPNQIVSITHLCIDSDFRGNGIPELLFNSLTNTSSNRDGISLDCRRDYGIEKLWTGLGFKAVSEKIGRGTDKAIVTKWWYDYGNENLFSRAFDDSGDVTQIVVDANIFIDFNDDDPIAEESKALLADWLSDKINIFITPEIHNEINRSSNSNQRELERKRLSYYDLIPNHPEQSKVIEEQLWTIYKTNLSEQDKSDIRHLSHAIAANIDYFITRDDIILGKSDLIYEKFSISVMRPSELIINIDKLERYDDYKPSRLAGTNARIQKIDNLNEDELAKNFQKHELGETKKQFLSSLRDILKDPINNDCYIIRKRNNDLIGLLCYKNNKNGEMEVPLIRAVKSSLEYTIIHYLAFKSTIDSYTRSNILTSIKDKYICRAVKQVLLKNNFSNCDENLIKLNVNKSSTSVDISNYMRSFDINNKHLTGVLHKLDDIDCLNKEQTWEIEKLIWPGKILNTNIDTYIVSIKPGWARDLFDHDLSAGDLFGSSLELALNIECAYYRSILNSGGLSSSSRILWYVSSDSQHKSLGIRACSQLEDVIITKPKDAYKEFRRLGVYKWNDIYNLADKDIEKEVMVLRFKNTEVFKKPIDYDTLCKILQKNDIGVQLLSPTKVNADIFNEIYSHGNNLK